MKYIFKVIIGIIIWLILVDIQWTFFDSHSIENIVFLVLGICLLLLITSGIYWVFKKKRILKFTTFGTIYLFTLSIVMILTNVVYDKITVNQYIELLKDIKEYKIKNGHIPKKLSDLTNEHYHIYGIIPHEFIYKGYNPFIWNGIGFDESKTESKTEKLVGYRTPMGYTEYRIANDENIDDVIKDVKKNVW